MTQIAHIEITNLEQARAIKAFAKALNMKLNMETVNDVDALTKEQEQGLLDALDEIKSGNGIPHEIVREQMRKKYSNDKKDSLVSISQTRL